jgi:hypothetical protein
MRVSPLVFDREFSRFKDQIRNTSNGAEFTSFHEGLAARWERYKELVRNEAIERLQAGKWKIRDVGTGKILKRVIAAIEINEHPQMLRNNLVAWQNRYGHDARAHSALIDAQTDVATGEQFEQWFFDLFNSRRPDGELFDSFRELVGKRYDLIAYLFFLKDWTRFMPIATQTFDSAFRLLEVDLVTAHHCSWENYQRYNDAIRTVQRRLRDVGTLADARLIDAHSFCWILVRLNLPPPPPTFTVGAPELLRGATASPLRTTVARDAETFENLDDAWFSTRNLNRRRIGKLAQDIAVRSELARLRADGHPSPETAVQPVWHQPARGYDILSEETAGGRRHIEVKAARTAAEGISFFLSANEWEKCQSVPNYWFYLVFGVESAQPLVKMLSASGVSKEALEPTNYLASFTIAPA